MRAEGSFWKRKLPIVAGVALGALVGISSVQLTRPTSAPALQTATVQVSPQAKEGIQTLRSFSDVFVAVSDHVKPSVVSILVEKRQEQPRMRRMPQGMPGQDPFEFFFGTPRGGGEGAPTVKGGGTGMVIREDGMILTNNHVVEDAESIKVVFNDGKEYVAKVKGTDPRSDLAVIQIEARRLPIVTLGDSETARVGEWVIAMGNPYGFDYTVTAGIVSAKSRKVMGGARYENFIQTDASINPGNSGGPLLNLDGEVIGINTMIAGIGTGIGFAIPSNMARNVSQQLMNDGKVTRPWLGVGIQPLDEALSKGLNLPTQDGALINQVYEGSPAEVAGLRRGDVIVKLQDKAIKDSEALINAVGQERVGAELKVAVIRDGKEQIFKVKTATLPEQPGQARGAAPEAPVKADMLGMQVEPVDAELARSLGMARPAGVAITRLSPDSPVTAAGLREGDVVLEINQAPVNSGADVARVLGARDPARPVLLLVRRETSTFFVSFKVSR